MLRKQIELNRKTQYYHDFNSASTTLKVSWYCSKHTGTHTEELETPNSWNTVGRQHIYYFPSICALMPSFTSSVPPGWSACSLRLTSPASPKRSLPLLNLLAHTWCWIHSSMLFSWRQSPWFQFLPILPAPNGPSSSERATNFSPFQFIFTSLPALLKSFYYWKSFYGFHYTGQTPTLVQSIRAPLRIISICFIYLLTSCLMAFLHCPSKAMDLLSAQNFGLSYRPFPEMPGKLPEAQAHTPCPGWGCSLLFFLSHSELPSLFAL